MKTISLTYLIDDDAIILLLCRRMLAKHGAFQELITFENAQVAIDQLNQCIADQGKLPDLILLDLNMPLMDGWEFLDACSQIPQTQPIPVFILSSSIDPADLAKCDMYPNVKAFFSKPLTNRNMEQILSHFPD